MKRSLIVLLFLICGFSYSQTFRGLLSISGQLSYDNSYDSGTDSRTKRLVFVPSVGYGFAPNWSLTIGAGYRYESYKKESADKKVSEAFVFTPSIKRFKQIDSKVIVFLQLEAPLEFGYKTVADDSKVDYWSANIRLRPGIEYILSPNWRVTILLGEMGYSYYKLEGQDLGDKSFKAGINFSNINIGVKYVFLRK